MREFSNCLCAVWFGRCDVLLKFFNGLHRQLADEVVSCLCCMVNLFFLYYIGDSYILFKIEFVY